MGGADHEAAQDLRPAYRARVAARLRLPRCAPAALAATPTTATGWVRCANLSAGSPAVDIYLLAFGDSANPTVLRHVSYGEVSSYMAVAAGQYTVAMRPVGASASSPPIVSVNFMVSAGTNYTVASLGPAAGRRLEVLKDQMAAPKRPALVRVIQASQQQDQVTVSVGGRRPGPAAVLRLGDVLHERSSRVRRPCSSARRARRPTCRHPGRRFGPHHRRAGRLRRAEDRQLTDAAGSAEAPRAVPPPASAARLRPLRPGRRNGWPRWPPGCC